MPVSPNKGSAKSKALARKSKPVLSANAPSKPRSYTSLKALAYNPSESNVNAFARKINDATPLEMIQFERHGVSGDFIAELAEGMNIPSRRIYEMLRIPPATAARKKTVSGARLDGRAGLAVIGMGRLIAVAQDMVNDSMAIDAQDFDVVRWLGQWIEQPQPALGGGKPAEFLDTPTGVELVCRVLGAMRSGAYL